MKILKIYTVIASLFFVSCISDVDFDQVDEIEIITPHLLSLVYFEVDSNLFLDDFGNEILFISDTTELYVFDGPYNEEYLIQADFDFKMSNSFDRGVTVQVKILDINDSDTFVFTPMSIAPNILNVERTQVIGEANMPTVVTTDKIVVNILMDSGSTPLDPNSNMKFDFQSGVKLLYKITVNE